MSLNVSAWAIRNPGPPILFCVLLLTVGMFSFGQLPIMRYPNIDKPVISVAITDSGVAPTELETQITKKVEDAVSGVAAVRHISSTVTYGLSSTSIEFRIGTNMDAALNAVQNAIARIRSTLPIGIDEPIVQRNDVQGKAIRSYAAYDPAMTPQQLSWFIDNTVVRELQGLAGVGSAERVGGTMREIQIRLAPDKLMALGVTALSVNQQLLVTNVDLPGGKSEVGRREQTVRTLASARSVNDLADMNIDLSNGRRARLGDLGTVVDTGEEPTTFANVNGNPVVAFSIHSATGASDVDVAAKVNAKIDDLARRYPDVTFWQIDDTVAYTYGNYQTAMDTLYEGAVLAVFVVLLFLRDWRATIIAAAALPLSAIPTFFVISMMGFSLNIISLLAITLAIGILVDDAIVEIENIVRHIHEGKSPFRAALEATDEIGLAVMAISLTIIVIFLPVSFMSGIAGQYFKQFGLTVAVAVFFSLLVARFVTPIMAAYLMRRPYAGDGSDGRAVYGSYGSDVVRLLSYFIPIALLTHSAVFWVLPLTNGFRDLPVVGMPLSVLLQQGWTVGLFIMLSAAVILAAMVAWLRRPHDAGHDDGFFMRLYVRLLSATLARGMRWLILAIGIASFVIAVQQMANLPSDFVPDADESRILASIELAPGSPLADTAATSREIARKLKTIGEIKSIFVIGGSSAVGTAEPRRATVIVNLVAKADRTKSQRDVQDLVLRLLSNIPDIRFSFDSQQTVAVVGNNGDDVATAALNLEQAMAEDPIFVNPMALASFASPELRVLPKLPLASDIGITPTEISQTIQIATTGAEGSALSNFTVDGRQIPIRVELEADARSNLDVLSALRVPRADGSSVPLSSVADMKWGEGPATVDRYDRQRLVSVGYDVARDFTSGQAADRVPDMAAVKAFPPGVSLQATGNAEEQDQMFSQFGIAMGSGILLVLVVLILLFKNVFYPITILSAMPLSLCGVVAALLLAHGAFSLSVTIGLLMLMGIVTKNTIMLVDFAVQRMGQGVPRTEAIIDACRKRARPIIMTTIAMIAGMLPATNGVGAGGELRAPMAIAVVGGLLASTLLSLVFIPSVYTIMDDISRLCASLLRWLLRPNDPEETSNNGKPVERADPFDAALDEPRIAAE
jgi:multidrug efflux pump subunit AcrB